MKSYIFIAVIMLIALVGCQRQQSPNYLYEYLNGAECQCETVEQKAEIYQLFQDMLQLSPDQLKKKRYKSYKGIPQWTAPYFLERHFVPDSQEWLDEDTFYEELQDPRAKKIIREWLQKIASHS